MNGRPQGPLDGHTKEGKKILMVSLKKDLIKRIIKWLLHRHDDPPRR